MVSAIFIVRVVVPHVSKMLLFTRLLAPVVSGRDFTECPVTVESKVSMIPSNVSAIRVPPFPKLCADVLEHMRSLQRQLGNPVSNEVLPNPVPSIGLAKTWLCE